MAYRNPAADYHSAGAVLAVTKREEEPGIMPGSSKLEHGMQLVCETLDDDEIEKIRVALAKNDVVTGPPLLRQLVETLWPENLHKVKPPRELMH